MFLSLAIILLFAFFIVPYFYLPDLMTNNGYQIEDGSRILGNIGVVNGIGMVSTKSFILFKDTDFFFILVGVFWMGWRSAMGECREIVFFLYDYVRLFVHYDAICGQELVGALGHCGVFRVVFRVVLLANTAHYCRIDSG